MTVKEILKDLVEINTIRDKCNKEIMDYIENFVTPLGFEVDRRKNPETGKEVLVASFGENPTLGFLGHTDTVDIADGWNYDPLTLTEEDGKLYGLGACDMKGGIAAALYAASAAPLDEIKAAGKGIKMYWTYDEEILFSGIHDLVNQGEVFPPHVVVGEPTDVTVNIGSKGLLEYIFTFHGVSTHSSAPIPGKNSNKNAVKFLSKMLDLEESLKDETYALFGVPHTTMNIGIMEGGIAMNTVPSETKVYLDFRICDSESQYERIRKYTEEAIAEFDADYEIINDAMSFRNEGDRVGWYEEQTGVPAKAGTGITEASFFTGSDRVILGPGPRTLHQANEHVTEEKLNKVAEIYLNLIKKECL